ncbi:rho GTPase-activating protein 22-like [Lampris incognitus]|uniref:rho GTPase-activating protein 22-like n=1 Tax=Lampris incognitus TaxID=2546036 RepID=UPI0024B577F5|nr:rho GTPase-activating protein 22-like [Lampris incognitus]
MREGKEAASRTGSHLSHSAYRKLKRALSFRPRVFGQRLEETVLYEQRYGMRLVPLVVEQCVAFIQERGLHEVGLFRQSGQATVVKELQQAFDAGERPSFDSGTDVHTVASLLKLYLRLLPEPLVPYSRYQDFFICGKTLSSDRPQGLLELKRLLHELPVANFNLLSYISKFLNEVQSHSSSNKMSCQNLATVFGPNILRAKAEDPHSIIGGAAVVQLLMLELIREHQPLFSKVALLCSTHPQGGLHASPNAPRQHQYHPAACSRQLSLPLITERRGRGGSVSSHRVAGQPLDQDQPAQSNNEHHNSCVSTAATVSQKQTLGHRYTSSHPESYFCPLPSTSHSLPQHHNDKCSTVQLDQHCQSGQESYPVPNLKAEAPTSTPQEEQLLPDISKCRSMLLDWTDAQPDLGEVGPCYWSSSLRRAMQQEGVVPGTASGESSEAKDDSTMSVYDNLDSASPNNRIVEVTDGHIESTGEGMRTEEAVQTTDSSSSWSSCEILPLDESSCREDCIVGGSSSVMSQKFSSNQGSKDDNDEDDGEDDNSKDESDDEDEMNHHNSPASGSASCSVPSDAPLSTGSSEVFLPSGPLELQELQPQPEPQDVHALLAELQEQITKQRAEYQARIKRLEECNKVLQEQVVVLSASLEQQKRWHSVAEIKMRNVERARVAADRRNATLQREMEQFFKMFGEISGEEKKGGRIVQSF